MNTLSDEQLVELATNNSSEAFGEIMKRWERKIFALCFGMLNREEDARDAVQETFIAAYRNLKNFRGEAKVSSWLHRIAVNQCLTTKRRVKTKREDYLEDEIENGETLNFADKRATPAQLIEQNEQKTLVRNAVRSLPFELKEVVIMKEFQDLTFQEISETLDLPLSTVKSRLYTALKQLRMKLERVNIQAA